MKTGRMQTGKKSLLTGMMCLGLLAAAPVTQGLSVQVRAQEESQGQIQEQVQEKAQEQSQEQVQEQSQEQPQEQVQDQPQEPIQVQEQAVTEQNYPRVDGSTATLPLSQAVYRLFTGCSQQEADAAVVHTKTTNAWLELIAGNTDLLIVADKNEKVDQALAESGVELDIKPIALDAFIFMTNENNPVTSLSGEEIISIYSGQVTNWSQLGGEDRPIIAFQRNENAGSQTAMKSLVMQGRELADPKELRVYTMSDLLTSVAAYNNEANAIGYSYYYYASLMMKTPGLRFMAVDGVLPSNDTVQRGEYPYIAGYYAAVRSDEGDTPARRIYDWLTTKEGQELIADLGYVPVDPEVHPEEIHADEQSEAALPIGEDEYLAVMTGRTRLIFIDHEGRVVRRLDNAACGSGTEEVINGPLPRMETVKKDEPMLLMKLDTQTEEVMTGLYIPSEDRFTIAPDYQALYRLSNGLYTDSSPAVGDGWLFRADGTRVGEAEKTMYVSGGNYAWTYAYDGPSRFYDGNGAFLFEMTGTVYDVYGDRILMQADGCFGLYGPDRQLIRSLDPKWSMYMSHIGDYISWYSETGEMLITDEELNPVVDAAQFAQINEGMGLPPVQPDLMSVNEAGDRILVMDRAGGGDFRYYLCDGSFHVLDSYDHEEISFDWQETDTEPKTYLAVPWRTSQTDGVYRAVCLFTGEEYAYRATEEESATWGPDFSVSRYKNAVFFWFNVWDNWSESAEICVSGSVPLRFKSAMIWGMTSDGLICLFKDADMDADAGMDNADRENTWWYVTEEGEAAEDGLIYAQEGLKGVVRGDWLYLEGTEGELYLRLLASDEES